MFIQPLQMRNAALIANALQLLELWHRHSKGLLNLMKPRLKRFLWRRGELIKEVAAEWITFFFSASLWITNQLRNNVKISNR